MDLNLVALSINVNHIVQSGGLLLLGLFLFAEVGLFLGFFLPGDTLLIAAGIYAKQGKLSLAAVIAVAGVAAVAGDNLAFYIGKHAGPRLFKKEDGVIFRADHITRAEKFYEQHGPKTLLVSHFIAVVRTFVPPLAGMAKMSYKKFLTFNIIGDFAWALIVTLAGYYVGSRIPNIDHYILIALAIVIIGSAAPTLYQLAKHAYRKYKA